MLSDLAGLLAWLTTEHLPADEQEFHQQWYEDSTGEW